MAFIRIREDYIQWPYSPGQLRADEPQLSLSRELPDHELATLAQVGVYVARVQPTEPPAADPRTERVEEVTPIQVAVEVGEEDSWLQQWTIRDATLEEIAAYDAANAPVPDYQAFYDALIASPVYQSISMKAALFQPLLAASTEFIAAFADAKAGHPNPDTIRMTVWKLFYWVQPSLEEVAMLQQMMNDNNLSELYPLQIPAPIMAAFESQPNPFRFYESILSSNFYQTKLVPIILSGASSIPGDATTIMGFAIKDAQAGLVPPPTRDGPPNSLQTRLWLFTAAVGPLLDDQDFTEMQGLLQVANLADMYTLTPPAPGP